MLKRERITRMLYDFQPKFFILFLLAVLCADFFLFDTKIWTQITLSLITLLSTTLYFTTFYFLKDKESLNKLKKFRISNYVQFQFKVVFLEEFLLRYIPLIIVILYLKNEMIICIVFSLIFTILHFYKLTEIPILPFIEFFLFFFITSILFIKHESFLVLFIPHFLRNIIIQHIRSREFYN